MNIRVLLNGGFAYLIAGSCEAGIDNSGVRWSILGTTNRPAPLYMKRLLVIQKGRNNPSGVFRPGKQALTAKLY